MTTEEYRALAEKSAKRSKFNNKRVMFDGHVFGSQAELKRYGELKLLQDAGEIEALVVHPRFALHVNGKRLGAYVGDFLYFDNEQGARILEDVKSPLSRTPIYLWKRRHMKAEHGIEILEVEA